MKNRIRCHAVLRRAAWLLLLALVGCNRGSLPAPANADEAYAALRLGLEDWKAKKSGEGLSKHSPPIYFNDPRSKSDLTLVDYKLNDSHEYFGQSVRIKVQLVLRTPDGVTKERNVAYLVDTSPSVVIVPD